jgi:glycerophosphoryl diester phosphodiesterase
MKRALATALGLLAAAPGGAVAAPQIHAHRGGPFVNGAARYAENTLPAFRRAHSRGFVVELDTRAAQDGAVALHDETLDRTTTCSGRAADMTVAAIAGCASEFRGSPGSSLGARAAPGLPAPPNLADVLGWAREAGARLNLELNDREPEHVSRVLDAIVASGYPPRRLIVQSFFAGDLATARDRLPGIGVSALALRFSNIGAVNAAANFAPPRWASPQWPVPRAYVTGARRRGVRVIPYTLNRARDIRRAARIGVGAVITDDPVMARRALRRR